MLIGRNVALAAAFLFLTASLATSVEPKKKPRNGPLFGSREPIPGALRGDFYRLFKDTSVLPDFTKLQPVGTFYTTYLDYPLQPCGDEWFGINYHGMFYVTKPGKHSFVLTSDDGAALYIDGKRIINNDGIHPAEGDDGSVKLDAGWHEIRVPYFQGPNPYVALILEVQPPGGKRRTFDMDDFRPPKIGAIEPGPTIRRK